MDLVKQSDSELFSVLRRCKHRIIVRLEFTLQSVDSLQEHGVVTHVLVSEECLGGGSMSEGGADATKHHGGLANDLEAVVNIHLCHEASIDIGMSIAASGHDLECPDEGPGSPGRCC